MLITFLVPIGIASFFAAIMPSGSGPSTRTKIPVLVVDEDKSPLVAKIVEGMRKDSMADPKLVSAAEADAAVKGGKSSVAVVFPKGSPRTRPRRCSAAPPPWSS